jgi:predicted unusual protein kinase regulating ubiquinone biosynthesis (AarF/ABC1/UbiB family)
VQVWDTATPEQRQFLATILDSGKGWVIMERARFTLDKLGQPVVATTISTDLSRQLTSAGRFVGDLHGGNIGYFPDGRFKVLDYAL